MIFMKKHVLISILLPILFFHISSVFAVEDLLITPRKQDLNRTCWAACCQMVLEYYYKTITQEAIVTWAVNGDDEGNSLSGSPKSCDKVLQSLPLSSPAKLVTHYCYYPITKENVQNSMTFNQPIIAYLEGKVGNPNHDVLIRGYSSGSYQLKYNDPTDGIARTQLHAFFADNPAYKWKESLELKTSHPNPGIFDGVTDPAGPELIQYSQSPTYSSDFVRKYPSQAIVTSWVWSMYFEYNDGTYSVPTGSITNTNLKSTCNFPTFTLPYNATKPWKYTAYGNVPGKVEVQGLDSDGYYHYGEKYVEYRMQNAFPALVYYQNITNSTAQPQVKAHYLIELTNDQLLSGSNITFKAGYTINIIDNITIGNGSYTNFIIDPSLVW